MSRAIQVYVGADLRCGHEGLAALAKKDNIDVSKLEPGEYLIFLNSEKNRLKLYAANNVIAYLKVARGRIDLRTIALIPQAFRASGKIQYDEILKGVLEKELRKRGQSF